ncbi:MAG: hypothetical protein LBF85_04060 [Tannerella sp.]|nr:hypothetical protein [Tannerella sp.]
MNKWMTASPAPSLQAAAPSLRLRGTKQEAIRDDARRGIATSLCSSQNPAFQAEQAMARLPAGR